MTVCKFVAPARPDTCRLRRVGASGNALKCLVVATVTCQLHHWQKLRWEWRASWRSSHPQAGLQKGSSPCWDPPEDDWGLVTAAVAADGCLWLLMGHCHELGLLAWRHRYSAGAENTHCENCDCQLFLIISLQGMHTSESTRHTCLIHKLAPMASHACASCCQYAPIERMMTSHSLLEDLQGMHTSEFSPTLLQIRKVRHCQPLLVRYSAD